MKNKRGIVIISLALAIIIIAIVLINLFNPTIRAVVVRDYQNTITVMDINDKILYSIGLPGEINTQFKQGQEVLIYTKYGAIIMASSPAQIDSSDIKKIKILKEISNIEIPERILRRTYNSSDNILISVDEFLPTKLTLTIKDKNPYMAEYKYSNDYYISIKKNNIYERLPKEDSSEIEYINIDNNTVKNIYNWEKVYGKLENGEYELRTSALGENIRIDIFIYFTVNSENKTITYEETRYWYIAY